MTYSIGSSARLRTALAGAVTFLSFASAALAQQVAPPVPTTAIPYSVYVASESGDIVTRIEVGPGGWRKANEVSVKLVPNEISGPHNVAVSPDANFWYVSIAHGTPNGSLWKFD